MNFDEQKRLHYRRQYVLSSFKVDCPFLHHYFEIGNHLNLYAHIDLNVTLQESQTRKLVLIGDLFDYEDTGAGNTELLRSLLKFDLHHLTEYIARFCGRFVLIYVENDQVYLMHDAASARKVYYYKNGEYICCASQPHLLAKVSALSFTADPEKLKFYNSDQFKLQNGSSIGNSTIYDDVYQLIPNHYLHFNDCVTTRYWPNKRIEIKPVETTEEHCALMIRGYMESIANRYPVMLPVTAGKDSRMLLSATKNVSDRVFYYLNKERWLTENDYDIAIPAKLLPQLGLVFNLVNPYIEIDEDFKRIYAQNNPFASALYLPVIYNYYKNFGSRVNLPGIFINIIEDLYDTMGQPINGELLAKFVRLSDHQYAIDYYQQWYDKVKEISIQSNLNVLNLFYWEERIANWGTQLQLDKDIAQEDIIPYNSRLLIETMLQLPMTHRKKPGHIIFHKIIRKLWPEALQLPFNPAFRSTVLSISQQLGIMKPVNLLYHSFLFQSVRKLHRAKRIGRLTKVN